MIGRYSPLVIAFAVGVAVATLLGLSNSVRRVFGLASEANVAQSREPAADEKQTIRLTDEQVAVAQIDLIAIQGGILARRLTVPGTIIPDADRIGRVSVKLSGTVAELRKKLGDLVAKDEVLAILESREVADAKSEYLAARLTNELQQELFERDKTLWEKNVATEQQYLRSRNLAAQTRMRLDISRQKLFALGLDANEIGELPNQPEALLRRQEVRSPRAGRVVERKVDLGTAVGRDNLETELFVVADLDRVWIELAVSPADLPAIKEGLMVSISARGVTKKAEGKVMFISPLLDRDTRAARVVAEIANADNIWRPGSFVTAAIAIEQQSVQLAVPIGAVQTLGNEKIVFVRAPDGFEKRTVVLGRNDDRFAEVTTGLQPGESVAVTNTFLLKAELMKGLAED
jgi:cobalt-zinc-cadmium efflux system membrane fusion protein